MKKNIEKCHFPLYLQMKIAIVLTLVGVVTSRFDNHIILGGYIVLLETSYNLWIENSSLISYDPTGSHT